MEVSFVCNILGALGAIELSGVKLEECGIKEEISSIPVGILVFLYRKRLKSLYVLFIHKHHVEI